MEILALIFLSGVGYLIFLALKGLFFAGSATYNATRPEPTNDSPKSYWQMTPEEQQQRTEEWNRKYHPEWFD